MKMASMIRAAMRPCRPALALLACSPALVSAAGFLDGGWYGGSQPNNAPEAPLVRLANNLTLTSAGLEDGFIQERYSCFGDDASLPVSWSLEVSEELEDVAGVRVDSIRSYALTLIDQNGAAHWTVYNIGTNQNGLEEGLPTAAFYNGVYQGRNDFLVNGYTGPCPLDSELQNYHLSLLALSEPLSFDNLGSVTYQDIASAVDGKILMSASLDAQFQNDGSMGQTPELTLTSKDFANHGMIPVQFTCDGNDVSPELRWSGAPEETVSYALLVTDTDPNAGPSYANWVVYNLPGRRTGINRAVEEGVQPGPDQPQLYQGRVVRISATEGTTIKNGYLGPCPPAYDGIHEYKFELFALDNWLSFNNPATVSEADVRSAISEQEQATLLAHSELTGKVERQQGGGTDLFVLTSPEFVDGGDLPLASKADFDLSVSGSQCASPPVDVDGLWEPGLTSCPDYPVGGTPEDIAYLCGTAVELKINSDGEQTEEPIETSQCCYSSPYDATQYLINICPDGKASCLDSAKIPVLDIDKNLRNAAAGASPALEWSGIPAGAVSLALVATDADLVGSGTTDLNNNISAHWVAYNIPPTLDTLDPQQPKNFFTNGYFNAFNDIWWRDTARNLNNPLGDGVLDVREDVGYWGACAIGNRIVFNLVALDAQLDFSGVETVTYSHVVNAMRGHIIGVASLAGRVPAE
jgi:Raf kinase inhibitor-like YbhB/YbcL family protein